jgi:hypothetical protein
MITIDARETHEVGNCQACDEFKGEILVGIRFQPHARVVGHAVYLCHTCARLLHNLLVEKHVR